jgi:hypothetical protein
MKVDSGINPHQILRQSRSVERVILDSAESARNFVL